MKTAQHLLSVLLFAVMLGMSANVYAQAKANTLPPGSYKTIFEMLRDVPGLEVSTTSDKTGGTVVIRGVGSLRNQKNPLIVVDGSIYAGDISTINPQDVDGISVLKDAASATAYGAQGAAGVIVITTKKGSGVTNNAVVSTHTESAYTYFIEHKTALKVLGHDEKVIVEGVIDKQLGETLVFVKKRKELVVPIKDIKRVELIRQ